MKYFDLTFRSIIGMLSMDLDLSSVSEDFEAVLTPPGKTNGAIKKTGSPLMLDEDSGLGMETDEVCAQDHML